MEPVSGPVSEEAQTLQRPSLKADATRGMRLLRRARNDIEFAVIEEQRTLRHERSGVGLEVVDVSPSLAELKLPVDVQP